MNYRGLLINSGYMEGCNNEYADQLCLYGWLLGEAVGDENVVLMIDEIVAKYMDGNPPAPRGKPPRSREQGPSTALVKRVAQCWTTITSGHVFQEMSPEDSKARCEVLDGMSDEPHVGRRQDGQLLHGMRCKPKW